MSTMAFDPITDEAEINEVQAGARGRGDYKVVLQQFIEAGIRMARIPLDRGTFEQKKASTVKTGFENAKNAKNPVEGADQVQVVKKEDQIYLVNKAVSA